MMTLFYLPHLVCALVGLSHRMILSSISSCSLIHGSSLPVPTTALFNLFGATLPEMNSCNFFFDFYWLTIWLQTNIYSIQLCLSNCSVSCDYLLLWLENCATFVVAHSANFPKTHRPSPLHEWHSLSPFQQILPKYFARELPGNARSMYQRVFEFTHPLAHLARGCLLYFQIENEDYS